MDTLKEAKQQLRDNFEKGTDCPCCGQFVKRYKRKINSGMAIFLVGLYRLDKKDTRNVFTNEEIYGEVGVKQGARDHAAMKHWGLIVEPDIEVPEAKRKNGLWAITQLGRDFIEGKITLPSHLFIFNSKCIGFTHTQTTIQDSLGKHFNYQELMSS